MDVKGLLSGGESAPAGQPASSSSDDLFDFAKQLAKQQLSASTAAYLDGKRTVAQSILHYVKVQLVVVEANTKGHSADYVSGVYDTILGVVERCNKVMEETRQ